MPVTDNFPTNGSTLGANWTDTIVGMSVSSNKAVPAGSGYNFARYTGVSWNAAHGSQAVFDGALGADMELTVRHQANGDLYMLMVNSGSGVFRIYSYIGGSFSQLGADLTGTPTNGHTYKLTVNGSTLEAFDNGASLGTRTDGNLSGGAPGIGGSAPAPGSWDDWEGTGEVTGSPARIIIQRAS